MEIRYIAVPEAVRIPVSDGDPVEWTFAKFLRDRTADPGFGASLDGILAAAEIRSANATPGKVVELQLPTWELLCAVIRKPGVPYNPEVMIHLIPHAKAVLDAPSTKP